MKKLVIIESPYFVKGDYVATHDNIRYAQSCMRDSLERGESPFLSHLLYTQILDDNIPEERTMGIEAGLEWGKVAEVSIVYIDRGISPGMIKGIESARDKGRKIIFRNLYPENIDILKKIQYDYREVNKPSLLNILNRLKTIRSEEELLTESLKKMFKQA